FGTLSGVAIDATGTLFASEDYNLRRITPDGQITTIHVFGPPFDYLTDVAVDPLGNVYAADAGGGQVAKLNSQGTVLQTTTLGFQPYRLAADAAGNVFITGRVNQWVWKRAADGT